jgi:hypothetical protein
MSLVVHICAVTARLSLAQAGSTLAVLPGTALAHEQIVELSDAHALRDSRQNQFT